MSTESDESHDDKDEARGKEETTLSGVSPKVTTEANLLVHIHTYTSTPTGKILMIKGLTTCTPTKSLLILPQPLLMTLTHNMVVITPTLA